MPRPLPPRLLAAALPVADAATDAELLRRFVRDRDRSALELVLRRHAAAVWTACRCILPDADAEDAFQATFLVLVRKAATVREASAGGWLHRVAVTTALKRKGAIARKPTADAAAATADPAPSAVEQLTRAELAAAVHEELARLPDRYRLPVVLCDLEGETQRDAAARLGWPVGSLAWRLGQARAVLRGRLARRGFAPAGSVLVLPLPVLPAATVPAVLAAVTGTASPRPSVSILVSGVLSAMRVTKLKLIARALTAAGLAVAVGVGTYTATAQPTPASKDAEKPAAVLGSGPIGRPVAPQEDKAAPATRIAGRYVHVAFYTFKPDTPAETVAAFSADAEKCFALVPSVRAFRVGPPAERATPKAFGVEPRGDYHVGVVLTFDGYPGLATYGNHPRHNELKSKYARFFERILAYDFEG